MAAPLNQDEIDALLSSDAFDDEPLPEESGGEPEPAARTKSRTKHFGVPVNIPFRFKFTYRSPIIKSQDILIDPDPEEVQDSTVVIVRSLSNYAKYRKKISA
ncbi:hypothetical protein ACFL6I_02025 [candidate division KSB1 bacterium]